MWAKEAVKHMNFGDIRRNSRLEIILTDLAEQPSASIPQACQELAATKAAYRFLSNNNANVKEIREGFAKATTEHMDSFPEGTTFLFVSDPTNLVYSSQKNLKGMGVLRNYKARGLCLQTTIVATEDELVLGAADQVCWSRKPEEYGKRSQRAKIPIEQKESRHWSKALRSAQESLPDNQKGIFIGDRGADIYDLFLEPRKENMDLLIRSCQDRQAENGPGKMFAALENSPCIGTMKVLIQRSGQQNGRTATLEIRCKQVTIKPPYAKKNLPSVTMNIISAREIGSGADTEELIHWRLLTTLPIDSLEQVIYAVTTYAKRWLVERYHYVLKEGCQVEKLQLEDADRIDKMVAICTIVACRLMYITYKARSSPDEPCTAIFSDNEWRALFCYSHKTTREPENPPTTKEAVMMLAKVGGFLGRKRDGDPGVKVIWKGMRILESAVEMYCILKKRCG